MSDHNDDSALYVGPPDDRNKIRLLRSAGTGGGEGSVFLGEVVEIENIRVCVKIAHGVAEARVPASLSRWKRQKDILLSLRHPGIVGYRDVFMGAPRHRRDDAETEPTELYLVMNWVDGKRLSDWVVGRSVSFSEVMIVVAAVGDALSYLHSGEDTTGEPVLHLDVKPANIIVDDRLDKVTLVDFGLSSFARDPRLRAYTPGYAPPEIVLGRLASRASDLFALAATTFELITGTPIPVDDRDVPLPTETLRAMLVDAPMLANQPRVVDALLQGLSESEETRGDDVRSWVSALSAAGTTTGNRVATPSSMPVSPRPSATARPSIATTPSRPSRPSGKMRAGVLAAVAVVALTASLVAYAAARNRDPGQTDAQATSPSGGASTSATSTTSVAQCADDDAARASIGAAVSKINEPCAFKYDGVSTDVVCPSGWVCTLSRSVTDPIIVQDGNGHSYSNVVAATFRMVAPYPSSDAVHDLCALARKEADFSGRTVEARDDNENVVDCAADGGAPTASGAGSGSVPVVMHCPRPPYQETGQQSVNMRIDVPAGEIAFIDAYTFDEITPYVFVTVTGPYSGQHTITAGAFCGGISASADYRPVREERLRQLPENPILVSLPSSSLPSSFTLHQGESRTVTAGEWSWACTGDIQTSVGGSAPMRHYDNDPSTGLVVALPQGIEVDVLSPYEGAFCTATQDLDAEIDTRVAAMAEPPNCTGDGCASVTIFRLKSDGGVASSETRTP